VAIAEELPDDSYITRPTALGGAGFDSQYYDVFTDELRQELVDAGFGDPEMWKLRNIVNGGGSLIGSDIALNAGGGVGAPGLGNSIQTAVQGGALTATAGGASGVHVDNAGPVTVSGLLSPLGGVSLNQGSGFGAITLDGPVSSGGPTLKDTAMDATRSQGFWLLVAGFFVCGFHVAFVATHFPAYVESQNLPAWLGATALGVVGFFNIIGTFLFGWLGGRHRKKWVLTLIYLARAGAIAGLLVLPMTQWTIWFFAISFGLLWLATVPLTGGLVGQIFGPRYMATLFGVVMFSHQIGAFFGAWLGGISYDLTGSYTPIWIAALILSLMSAALHAPIEDTPLRPEPYAVPHGGR